MNIKIFYIRLFVLSLFAASMVSCSEEFLEVTPKGNLIAQNTEDYDLLLEDPSLRELSDITVPMGDEVAAIEPFYSTIELRPRRTFQWQADIYNPDQNSQELKPFMASLYVYNKIINEVSDSNGGTDSEKQELEAEARLGRAFNYFMLINYYGKPYDATTASSDLGLPIITYSNITSTNFTRNTVEEVYDFIIEDIESAIPYLPESVSNRHRASKAAAEGLLGKILMFQHKYDSALEHLNQALNYAQSSQINVDLYDYNIEFLDGGVFTPLSPFFGPASILSNDNTEVLYDKSIFNAWAFINNEFVISTETANLYNSSDLRLNFFSDTEFFGFSPYYPNGMLRKVGPLQQQAGVYLPDVYLLIIEANARLGFLEEATTALEDFRSKRMPVSDASIPTEIGSNQYDLVKFIFEERIREFPLSGYRWFDMRRLSVDPDYNDLVNYTHNKYSSEGDLLESYTLTPERLVLRFGGVVTSQNPNLIEND
ncbi:RagB/SusD family nutrient uptake outer membrane protein [Confluentibacter sediminis]|uniref:RagB/SusD family nutrient uptake outer membrane protein n=1 Tax=Confluentibacter sediminis TaxID=2219045 RepID=UPI000DAB7182|nr:RagB/SusD family nutrient uptake outer membrane protein [Confluentibacter sediminis]